ncbi:hypothetical protein [Homoserinibacter sp. GY 40078]|uniref:hypothetical protein n=1 Tax=Homoserinibacter sp. GY 40078 TaxID=2603275 RepID=UPI0011C7639A|nr:hypothetical protein [Homoserinibacter sp. GY 40078]TXK17131.1 hypothetical protein FVQ89_09685 [Homoserinibacter sp. GY 40078]
MVAQLLRLRLRVLLNAFRRPPGQAFGLAVVLVLAVVGAAVLWFAAPALTDTDGPFAISATVVIGSWLVLASLLLPLMLVRREDLPPRAFLGYPISSAAVCVALFVFLIVGPGILIVPIAFAPVRAWSDPLSVQMAWAAAPLLLLQGLLTMSLARRGGVALRRRPRLGRLVRVVGTVVLIVVGVAALLEIARRVPELLWVVRLGRPFYGMVGGLVDALALTPFGMLWAAPGTATSWVDDPAAGWRMIGAGAVLVVVLAVAWFAMTGAQLSATRRHPRPRRARAPGWFRRFPATSAGAIAGRSFTYWVRDPRYLAIFVMIPVIPALMLLALWVGGVPFSISVLVPLPVLTLLVAWSTLHNDVAYDSTAVWQHVASPTQGAADRSGRAVPVLIWGTLLLAAGIPLTAWGHGATDVVVPLTGVCVALLLGGVGIASAFSARFPYAAPRPGDRAWQSPQVPGSQGGVAQSMSILLTLLVAAPALGASALWWLHGGFWGWVALAAGVGAGLTAYAGGLRAGGATFDRRGPELLAFTSRN